MDVRNKRKKRIAVVIGDKMNKGILVRIGRTTKHPIYKRR